MRFLAALALLIFSAIPAAAQSVVMFTCDSRCGTGGADAFPALVQAAHPEVTVCNRFHNGWTSAQGLAGFQADWDACSTLGQVTKVFALYGVNDLMFVPGATNAGTALNLGSIIYQAWVHGASGWIVSEPPAPVLWGGVLPANKWVQDNRDAVQFQNGKLAQQGFWQYPVLKAQNKFTETPWFADSCSIDRLHPTGHDCRQLLADAFSTVLP